MYTRSEHLIAGNNDHFDQQRIPALSVLVWEPLGHSPVPSDQGAEMGPVVHHPDCLLVDLSEPCVNRGQIEIGVTESGVHSPETVGTSGSPQREGGGDEHHLIPDVCLCAHLGGSVHFFECAPRVERLRGVDGG